ncbi:MAG: aminopeptidase N [Gammaproteobacteria bacterium]|nr:aminopeptidase N [Gammaproteobacteria bacterium]MBQ0838638.1 aminopeptidase N [Gammaproteobacteria bacterium]
MSFRDSQPKTIRLEDYKPPLYLIDKTELRFELGEEQTLVKAALHFRRNPRAESSAADNTLRLHGQELGFRSLAIDGQALSPEQYQIGAEELVINNVPEQFLLESVVAIKPQENTSLEGLYKSRTMYCTQCEAEGFRKITWYLDRPDVMSEFTTTVEADKNAYPLLLSNGNPVDSGETPDGRHWVTWHDPFKKPAYLFALVAGSLSCIEDSFTTMSGRDIALRIYVEAKDLDKCDHAMQSLKNAMTWDEEVYGREYDLDIFMIVAVDDFNMGAMENKGLNIFNTSCVLAKRETTTDAGFQRVEAVVAHEYFHNWSGNRVTCRDWFQLSLKEGFTVFRDAQFSADMGSPTVKRVEDVNFLRTLQFAEDGGPTAHPVQPAAYMEISNFYTLTIYEKGAEVVRMLHTLLGPELFRAASDLYFERHDGEAATIDDFIAAMTAVSGRDFSTFMHWYRQGGTPRLAASGEYDAAAQLYSLTLSQTCPPTPESADKEPFHIPIRLGLVGGDGDLPLHLVGLAKGETEITVELTAATQTLIFENVTEEPIPSLLRGFSAPVKLDFPYSRDQLLHLMRYDSDSFNRWEACNKLALGILQGLIDDVLGGRELLLDGRLIEAYRALLDDKNADPAMVALMLALPSEAYLSEVAEVIEVAAIHRARQFARTALAEALASELTTVYRANELALKNAGNYAASGAQIAQRSLKNTALAYLLHSGDSAAIELAYAQFQNAGNMSDTSTALVALVNCPAAAAQKLAQQALGEFYSRWQEESLVVNQWFQIQAWSTVPSGLARVQHLMRHPAFDIKNPNKVRSLIAAFCSGNAVNFHGGEGEAYVFLADQVLALDALNPQIASRIITPLTKWRQYPEPASGRMKAQLQRVLAKPELSKDVYEIVNKSLV